MNLFQRRAAWSLLQTLSRIAPVLLLVSWSTAFADRPNILLIITDDQGWGDVRVHGNPQIETPVLDHLASESVRLERFFVSPVCAPTRAALLTGRYYPRTGVDGVTRGFENMSADELTLAEALKTAGYATGCFGKWHNGRHYPMHPNGQGFDEFFGFCGGHWNSYFDTPLEHNGAAVATEGYITDVLTDAALRFIDSHRQESWFCYLPYNVPHWPGEVPEELFKKYKQRGLDDHTACAYAMVERVDTNIGRLLKHLHDWGLRDDTIVLFMTDNGPNGDRYNGNMRGRKGSIHEGGVRVPCFIRWPAGLPGDRNFPQIAADIDLLPTLLGLADVERPDGPPLDGMSLVPLLKSGEAEWPERTLFQRSTRGRGAARTDRWRAPFEGGRWSLFDMIADPGQHVDVAEQHPQVLAELKSQYDAWDAEVSQGLRYIRIPVGYGEWPDVELPANEAFLQPENGAGIEYLGASGYANTWIRNWTSTKARPVWKLNVVDAGEYEVKLLYTCRKEDVGSRIRVAVGDAKLDGVVQPAHDPPLLPSDELIPPSEHYGRKQFAELSLGTIWLSAGETELTVEVLEKPGEYVMDLKALRLTRHVASSQ